MHELEEPAGSCPSVVVVHTPTYVHSLPPRFVPYFAYQHHYLYLLVRRELPQQGAPHEGGARQWQRQSDD